MVIGWAALSSGGSTEAEQLRVHSGRVAEALAAPGRGPPLLPSPTGQLPPPGQEGRGPPAPLRQRHMMHRPPGSDASSPLPPSVGPAPRQGEGVPQAWTLGAEEPLGVCPPVCPGPEWGGRRLSGGRSRGREQGLGRERGPGLGGSAGAAQGGKRGGSQQRRGAVTFAFKRQIFSVYETVFRRMLFQDGVNISRLQGRGQVAGEQQHRGTWVPFDFRAM